MMASVVVGGNRRKSLTLRGVDPETCMIVFKNHWMQVVKILEKHEPSRSSSRALGFLSGHHGNSSGSRTFLPGPIPADEASAVQNYVEHMLFLLMEEEAGQGGAMGPILEFVVLEGVMERLFLWSLRRQFTEDMKLEQLRMYQMLLSQAKQPLLHHKPVLRPLMMLLTSCAGAATDTGGVVEAELVQLLNQLCVALVKDPSVLELFFHTSQDQGAANFLLFSLLIPYTHRQGLVGQQARDALLLIMSLSASEPRVAQHIAENTYFCPVNSEGSTTFTSQDLYSFFDREYSEDFTESDFRIDLNEKTHQSQTEFIHDNQENCRRNRLSLSKKRRHVSEASTSSQLMNVEASATGVRTVSDHKSTYSHTGVQTTACNEDSVIYISSDSEDGFLPQEGSNLPPRPPPSPAQEATVTTDLELQPKVEPEPEPQSEPEPQPDPEATVDLETEPQPEPEPEPERPFIAPHTTSRARRIVRNRRADNVGARAILIDGLITESLWFLEKRARSRKCARCMTARAKLLLQATKLLVDNVYSDAKLIAK